MRHAVFLPPFDGFADPCRLVDLAIAAEEAGWDGVFLWDHMLRWPGDRSGPVGDTWLSLAAMASRTSRVLLGPCVTPLPRRRPQKVAREAVSLDHLSAGRLVLGVGLGVNSGGELERFGEPASNRELAGMLDESLELIFALWSGTEVSHSGKHYRADGVTFLPRPLQQPRPPVWCAASGSGKPRPLRRAARLDGLFPDNATPESLGPMLEVVAAERGTLDGFDVVLQAHRGSDMDAFARAGATWAFWSSYPPDPVDDVMRAVIAGPGALAR